MATTFKTFLTNDVVSTRTMLHEAIPMTGTIASGTYTNKAGTEYNVKNYSHGMFQSVYDYPYLSSSANHIYDIAVGYSANSALSGAASIQNSKKINIYNQMAQVLMGHSASGEILRFDQDGDLLSGGTKLDECVFFNFSRLLSKDEIKKGSFSATFLTGGTQAAPFGALTITDSDATNDFRINSPAGEYGILKDGSSNKLGLLFYQAGVAVVTASVFTSLSSLALIARQRVLSYGIGAPGATYDTSSMESLLTGSHITASCDAIRNRLQSVSFNNTTELNSTIYFCRVNHNDYNYTSNPTYLSGSKIRVKNSTTDSPVSYITTVGLYSADNELLAVAKLSEPLKKDPTTEFTLRVRLDY